MDFQLEYRKAIARGNTFSPGKYFLVFMLIAVSGNPVFTYLTEWTYIFFAAILSFVAFISRKPIVNKLLLTVFAAFFFLFVIQYLSLENVSVPANINKLAKIYCGFLVMTIVGAQFRETYLKVMVFICIISLIGWLVLLIQGSIPGIQFDRYTSIFFYNLTEEIESEYGFALRNSGMFWEPGAFQGYINLALLLYIGDFKEFYKEHKKAFLILTLALISTQSSTGYIVYGFLIGSVIIISMRRVFWKIVALSFIVAVSAWGFNHIDFLSEKFKKEYIKSQEVTQEESNWSRTGAAIIALENLKRHPYIGNGDLMESRYLGLGDEMNGSGNGFFGEMNIVGIPAMLIFLILIYRSYPYRRQYKFIFVIAIVLLLQGEAFLNYPIFYSLFFIQYPPPSASTESQLTDYKSYKKYLKIAK